MEYTRLDGTVKNYDKFIAQALKDLMEMVDEEEKEEQKQQSNRMTAVPAEKQ